MPAAHRCPRCGAELSSRDAQGLCASCLLQAGLESLSATGSRPDEATTEALPGGGGAVPTSARTAARLPEPGQRFGNYRLLRRLGKGGMGEVFEAEDLASGRRVALKLLVRSLESPEARNRFFREGRLAASVNHPNSVYVYGTEEIDGTPAISMEHVVGGTLHERVRQRGPLPVTEAVDAILQIIDGLEAAAAVGVLHRDVKPSNCFVDADGTVKVGDFGLSISTSVREETHVTSPGSFLGTPAFSSPEQLRGDELDVRSDIYAVGVTLFYLLTGRTPHDADTLVKLLATVLERPAPSPARFREEIPAGLCRVILRCLAKQPAERFKNYAELREALIPYNSTAPTPATLAWRFAAGVCDNLLWSILVMSITWVVSGGVAAMIDPALFRSPSYLAAMLGVILLWWLYFAIPEGLWGASLGKASCRLRVVDRSRSRIGVPKALLRTAIFITFPSLISYAYWIGTGRVPFDLETVGQEEGRMWIPLLVSYSYYVMLALLFSTARRRNGYAGLHDLAVGSRVIRRSAYQPRPRLEVPEEQLPDVSTARMVGPYHVLDSLGTNQAGQFLLGYDLRLLRRVWIHQLPPGSPPVSLKRRNMGRVGRLRWINGRRDGDECWDAYEALSGQPLVNLIEQAQPWHVVRYWLLDLARELKAAREDGTLPPGLGLDRAWVTAAGRVKLLDFPAPGIPGDRVTGSAAADHPLSPAGWVREVATAALHDSPDPQPLPLEARNLLNQLPAAQRLDAVCSDLQRLVRSLPAVTRARRFGMLAATAALPLLLAGFGAASTYIIRQMHQQHPEIAELRYLLAMEGGGPFSPAQPADRLRDVDREALETYIAGKFRPIVTEPRIWNSFAGLTIPAQQRHRVERIIAERPAPSAAELAAAAATLEPILEQSGQLEHTHVIVFSPAMIGSIQFLGTWLFFVTFGGLIAVAAFRCGLIMWAFGVDCVTRRSEPASRPRMLWRTIVFNAPVLLAPLLFVFAHRSWEDVTTSLPVTAAALAVLAGASSLLPSRGLADRLAGTYPVPR